MRFGIIGYGGMGSYHCRMINELGERVTGGFDISQQATHSMESAGIKSYSSAEALFKSDIECVIIATPNDSHMQYAVSAAQYKKHIVCEKPAALSSGQYKSMVNAANENKVMLVVHQNRRWDSDYILLKQIMSSNVLGRIYKIESRVMAANGIPGDWRKDELKGGGMMLDWGVHLLDQAFLLFEPLNYDCTYSYVLGEEVEDGFEIKMRGNDLEYVITVDTNSFISMPRWRVYGENGTAQIDDWDLNGKIVIRSGGENNPLAITAGNGLTKTMSNVGELGTSEIPLPKQCALQKYPFYKMFLRAVKTGKSEIEHSQVIKVLEFMEAVSKSAHKIM